MSGHSHAANIAHRKGIVDAKRGKLFSKLCRAIQVAAKNGGGDWMGGWPIGAAFATAATLRIWSSLRCATQSNATRFH